ncbi:hypothetical protein BD847_0063 [Flavobacterium cutihirudinis]|uniref:Uncharacterized protein n=1 Tax=Flavobacterium cutihirudinis TaxID=1265740 RepID=A0A3D9FZ58_9FLAO|nr:hypothetical protein [Flavobacterium cutihirudinis]RED26153.1 hypothetical protein BD847_0063 [Flavobacterium cutihirudinis]
MDFNILEEGEFSEAFFVEKINQAKRRIVVENNLTDFNFDKVRHSLSISLSTNGRSFQGQYIIYEVQSGKHIICHLECFMDHNFKYIDIVARSIN